jgi:hypothetical protein
MGNVLAHNVWHFLIRKQMQPLLAHALGNVVPVQEDQLPPNAHPDHTTGVKLVDLVGGNVRFAFGVQLEKVGEVFVIEKWESIANPIEVEMCVLPVECAHAHVSAVGDNHMVPAVRVRMPNGLVHAGQVNSNFSGQLPHILGEMVHPIMYGKFGSMVKPVDPRQSRAIVGQTTSIGELALLAREMFLVQPATVLSLLG